MSKAAHQVVASLQNRAKTVYELSMEIGRSLMSTKTIIFELRRCGYLETVGSGYPALYGLTPKASGPIVIEWKARKEKPSVTVETMVSRTIMTTANSVFSLGSMR